MKATALRTAFRMPAKMLAASLGVMLALCLSACSEPEKQSQSAPEQAAVSSSADQPQSNTKQTAQGDATVKELEVGTDYKDIDLLADGMPNSLRIEEVAGDYEEGLIDLVVKIDGKEAYRLSSNVQDPWFYYAKVRYVKTANGRPFLEMNCFTDNDYRVISGLFEYDSGQLIMVQDFLNFVEEDAGSHRGGEVKDVQGNVLTVNYSLMSYLMGADLSFDFDYAVDDAGVISPSSRETDCFEYLVMKANGLPCTAEADQCLTSVCALEGLERPDGDSQKTLLQAGTKLMPKAVAVEGDDLYVKFQEKGTGKSYWIEGDFDYEDNGYEPPFAEVGYAG